MSLEVLSPHRGQKIEIANDASVVLKLIYGKSSVLLMADAPKKVERDLVSMYGPEKLKSDILKLGHHGSKTSSDASFVGAVNPRYGIISAGCHNSYGHPHPETLRLLDEQRIIELNTCELGDIIFTFDGMHWKLQKEQKKR